jgi:hypothetical protein
MGTTLMKKSNHGKWQAKEENVPDCIKSQTALYYYFVCV